MRACVFEHLCRRECVRVSARVNVRLQASVLRDSQREIRRMCVRGRD